MDWNVIRFQNVLCKLFLKVMNSVYRSNGGKFYGFYHQSAYEFEDCTGSEDSLMDYCSYKVRTEISYVWDDLYGVKCYESASGILPKQFLLLCYTVDQFVLAACTHEGNVRLVNGESENEGRIEYCYNGTWVPLCNMNEYTASLVCKELGYTNSKLQTIASDEVIYPSIIIILSLILFQFQQTCFLLITHLVGPVLKVISPTCPVPASAPTYLNALK